MILRKNRVSFWRKVRGLSQVELAELVGVTYVTISNWERDITRPTEKHVHAMARMLGVRARDLYPYEPY